MNTPQNTYQRAAAGAPLQIDPDPSKHNGVAYMSVGDDFRIATLPHQLPDGSVIQYTFKTERTVHDLIDFVDIAKNQVIYTDWMEIKWSNHGASWAWFEGAPVIQCAASHRGGATLEIDLDE